MIKRYTNLRLFSLLLCVYDADDLNSMGLRLRVYGGDRLRRDRLIGEKFIAFSSLDLDDLEKQGKGQPLEKLVELEPRSNIEVTVCVCVCVCMCACVCRRFVH